MKTLLALLALWLVLNESVAWGHILLGSAIAGVAAAAFRRLHDAAPVRRPMAAVRLLLAVAADVLRSNVAVARIVLGFGPPARRAGFLPITLALEAPAGLAVLACIVTATPGTSWVRYERRENLLTLHVLDLSDPQGLAEEIKRRYERPLMEIFQ
jgi:multicomponent K+:H+ antiporter subunit E